MIFFRVPDSRTPNAAAIADPPTRPNLHDIFQAAAREVIDQEQNVHVQHGGGTPDFFQSMVYIGAAVLHQLA
jgi:hypothetical protein